MTVNLGIVFLICEGDDCQSRYSIRRTHIILVVRSVGECSALSGTPLALLTSAEHCISWGALESFLNAPSLYNLFGTILVPMAVGAVCLSTSSVFRDLHGLFRRLLSGSSLDLTSGFVTGLRFSSYTLNLDDIDEVYFLVLIIICNRTQIDVILVIWDRVPRDVFDSLDFIFRDVP